MDTLLEAQIKSGNKERNKNKTARKSQKSKENSEIFRERLYSLSSDREKQTLHRRRALISFISSS